MKFDKIESQKHHDGLRLFSDFPEFENEILAHINAKYPETSWIILLRKGMYFFVKEIIFLGEFANVTKIIDSLAKKESNVDNLLLQSSVANLASKKTNELNGKEK